MQSSIEKEKISRSAVALKHGLHCTCYSCAQGVLSFNKPNNSKPRRKDYTEARKLKHSFRETDDVHFE